MGLPQAIYDHGSTTFQLGESPRIIRRADGFDQKHRLRQRRRTASPRRPAAATANMPYSSHFLRVSSAMAASTEAVSTNAAISGGLCPYLDIGCWLTQNQQCPGAVEGVKQRAAIRQPNMRRSPAWTCAGRIDIGVIRRWLAAVAHEVRQLADPLQDQRLAADPVLGEPGAVNLPGRIGLRRLQHAEFKVRPGPRSPGKRHLRHHGREQFRVLNKRACDEQSAERYRCRHRSICQRML